MPVVHMELLADVPKLLTWTLSKAILSAITEIPSGCMERQIPTRQSRFVTIIHLSTTTDFVTLGRTGASHTEG